jgi:hypothetical protein
MKAGFRIIRNVTAFCLDWTAWTLIEIAILVDCWGPFAWFYSAGNYLYGLADYVENA